VGTVRIRWSGVGKIAIVAVAALLALQTLPGLLRPPQPPPLGEDVGLPQVPPPTEPPPKLRFESPPVEDKGTTGSARRDVISSRPRKKRPKPKVETMPAPAAPPPPVSYEPPASPLPVPPPPPPAPPGDGSEEFAPR